MGHENSDSFDALIRKVRQAVEARPAPTAEELAAEKLQVDTQEAFRRNARRERIGIPKRVWAALDGLQEHPTLAVTRDWLAGPKAILVLTGLPDRSKTVSACWALTETPGPCQFVKAIEIVRRGMFDTLFWDALDAAPLVVLDDLGTEPIDDKGYALANFQALIDGAYDGGPRLIVTSNMTIEAFSARYLACEGGRSLQRVRESGTVVECVEGDGFRPQSTTTVRV